MATPSFAQLSDPSQSGPGFGSQTYPQRMLTILSMIASGQNPDGTSLYGTGITTASTSSFAYTPTSSGSGGIILSPPPNSDPFLANSVTLTVTAPALGWAFDLAVIQDAVGGRYANWQNIVWVDNKVPGLNLAPGAVTPVHLWSPDGISVYGSSQDSGPFPGVDPFTVPGVVNITEAWCQPYTTGTTMPSSYLARLGPNLAKVTNAFTLSTFGYAGTLLGPLEINRAVLNGSGTTQDGDGTFNTLANVGFTVVCAFVYGGAGSGDDPIVHNYNPSSQGQINLSVANTGGGNFYVVSGTNTGNLFSNYSYVPNVGSPYVVTLIVPASGGAGIFRLNGVTLAPSSGTIPWGQTLAMSNQRINKGAQSSFSSSTGLNKYASIISAANPLPAVNPTDPVPLLERWAGAQIGVVV